ncbi:MAG TPA: YciI family protein [Longimicrobium sp.]|jgi:hypothetical protein|uniref:YciI family protein n=1 Tax=Longimicrobium sp. TaxID=2029185 RepID=UPI002ED8B7EE
MRFMNFVSCPENLGAPPQSFIDAMNRAAEDAARAGTLLDTGGLAPVARSTRVRVSGGKLAVIDGPYAEGKEVVGGYGVVEAASREEAVEGAVWLMNMHLQHWPGWEGEVEVRQILDPQDSAPPAQP